MQKLLPSEYKPDIHEYALFSEYFNVTRKIIRKWLKKYSKKFSLIVAPYFDSRNFENSSKKPITKWKYDHPCGYIDSFAISPGGIVRTCAESDVVIAKLKDWDFKELLAIKSINGTPFSKLKILYSNECKNCIFRDICNPCPIVSKKWLGDIHAPDPIKCILFTKGLNFWKEDLGVDITKLNKNSELKFPRLGTINDPKQLRKMNKRFNK